MADHIVRDTIQRPLSPAPAAIVLGFGTISIRGDGRLDAELSDESEALALLGIPPDSEDGIALWMLLN